MKKHIYFVQANPVYTYEGSRSTYLPYAAGCLLAYAFSDDTVSREYEFKRYVYTREGIEDVLASVDNPSVFAFSCSVWNMEYNLALAKCVKREYPGCIIIFGGHQVSPDAADLVKYPFVDFIIHNGGEETFKNLLVALAKGCDGLESISNLSYRTPCGDSVSSSFTHQTELDRYPSPYLTGWFDSIIDDDFSFSTIIETNRGCPNNCAFCDWGVLHKKVSFFPLERVMAELQWIADRKIEYVFCGDGNFGLFDRDLDIAREVVRLKNEYSYPQKFRVSFTKNRVDMIEKISALFHDNNIGKSQTLSFQSLSPIVLQNIGRKNVDLGYFSEVMAAYNQKNISVFSELILGLPGETYDSFISGMSTLLELSQHRSISVYPCELLPNSRLGSREYIEKFQIQCVKTPFNAIHCSAARFAGEIEEYTDIVVSTSTMTAEAWVKSVVFSCFVQALHNFGVFRLIAMYIRTERSIPYKQIYTGLLSYFEKNPDSFTGRLYCDIVKYARGVTTAQNAWACQREGFGEICWGFEEIIALELVFSERLFLAEIRDFVASFNIDEEVLTELFEYQFFMTKRLDNNGLSAEFSYDFYSYFKSITCREEVPLKKQRISVRVQGAPVLKTKEEYAKKIIWYGRRDGLTLLSDSDKFLTVDFEGENR